VDAWLTEFFDREIDDIGNTPRPGLVRIARHIAQKQTEPQFYSFEDREKYDLDGIARKRLPWTYVDVISLVISWQAFGNIVRNRGIGPLVSVIRTEGSAGSQRKRQTIEGAQDC
jgi:hypothetical protein